MDSSELRHILVKLSEWFPFSEDYIKNAPQQHGIYIIRMANGQRFGRLNGESDILYIGCTRCRGGLRQRLFQYFHPGSTQWTNRRINEIMKKYPIEVAWHPCQNPQNLEHSLLKKYLEDHDELPPFNHANIRRLI